jgi:integrase
MTRRGKGEGSAPVQRSDGLWSAYVTLGYVNGKSKRQYVYAKTRRQCAEKLRGILGRSSSAILPAASAVGVVAWLERFVDEKQTARAPSTIMQWRYSIKRLRPFLEHLTLQRLTPAACRFAMLQITNVSGSVQQHTFDFLRAALEDAVKLGMIDKNPCAALERPKAPLVRERKVLQPEQLQAVLNASVGHPLETLIRLGYSYGLRIGELLALRWSDWDVGGKRLMVRHTKQQGSGLVLRPAKSGSSGGILVDATTAAAIEAQRLKNQTRADELKALGGWAEHDLIFPSSVGTALEYHNVKRSLQGLFARAGVPYASTHVMRRTYISLALRQLNIREVADVVRHKSTRMTADVYAQTLEASSPRAAISLEQLLHPNYTPTGENRQKPPRSSAKNVREKQQNSSRQKTAK